MSLDAPASPSVNFVPIDSGTDVRVAWFTDSEPPKLECLPASASNAKILSGGALMTRSTFSVLPSIRQH